MNWTSGFEDRRPGDTGSSLWHLVRAVLVTMENLNITKEMYMFVTEMRVTDSLWRI